MFGLELFVLPADQRVQVSRVIEHDPRPAQEFDVPPITDYSPCLNNYNSFCGFVLKHRYNPVLLFPVV